MPDRQDDLNSASDLSPFADALKRLAPQPPHLSRDALLFEAGKAAGTSRLKWAWPGTAAVFAGVSFVLAAFLMSPDSSRTQYVERVVYVERAAAERDAPARTAEKPALPKKSKANDESLDEAKAYQVRRDVLRWGIEMLPEPKPAAKGPSQDAVASEVRHWLNLPPGTFALPPTQPKKSGKKEDDNE
jgi:hypothetical protein